MLKLRTLFDNAQYDFLFYNDLLIVVSLSNWLLNPLKIICLDQP